MARWVMFAAAVFDNSSLNGLLIGGCTGEQSVNICHQSIIVSKHPFSEAKSTYRRFALPIMYLPCITFLISTERLVTKIEY